MTPISNPSIPPVPLLVPETPDEPVAVTETVEASAPARYAVLVGDVVSTLAIFDEDDEEGRAAFEAATGWTLVKTTTEAQVGDVYSPSAGFRRPVPAALSPLQARRALRMTGLKAAIDAFVPSLPEEAIEEWEYAVEIRRDNPTLNAAASAFGKTAEELDDLFRLGATL